MKPQDFDRLSAYIDDQLSLSEKAALEQRLGREPELQAALSELRLTVKAVRSLPMMKPPRNFTLTAAQAGLPAGGRPQRRSGLFGSLRLAASLSALALALVVGGDFAATRGLLGAAASPAQDLLFTTTENSAEVTTAQEAASATPETEMAMLGAAEETPTVVGPEVAPSGGAGSDAAPTAEASLDAAAALMPDAPTPTPTVEPLRVAEATPAEETAIDVDETATRDQYDAAAEATPGTKELPPADGTLAVTYGTEGAATPSPTPAPGLPPLRVLEAALAMLTVLLGLGAWLASRNP